MRRAAATLAMGLVVVAASSRKHECNDPAKAFAGNEAAVDALRAQFDSCGFVAIMPGLLQHAWIEETHDAALALVDSCCSFGQRIQQSFLGEPGCSCAQNSGGRHDVMPPFRAPFGAELVTQLRRSDTFMGLARALLGPDFELDFVSVLIAHPGASQQPWHGEGRSDGQAVKSQIPLSDIASNGGMIEMIHGDWISKDGFFTGTRVNESEHVVRPKPFAAGSVFVYRPMARHRGGANRSNRTKVVLDVMLTAKGVPSEDDTPLRWGSLLPWAWQMSDVFVRLPMPSASACVASLRACMRTSAASHHSAWRALLDAWHSAGDGPADGGSGGGAAPDSVAPSAREQKGEL